MDYELEQKLLLDALRSAKESQQVGLNQHVPNSVKTPFGDMLVAHGPGTLLGNVATRGIGQFNERNAVQKARDLSAQEQGEYEALQKQLLEPVERTTTAKARVLVNTLNPEYNTTPGSEQSNILAYQDSAFVDPTEKEVDIQVDRSPEDIARAEHDKRMRVAMGMYRLPKARAQAEKLFAKGVDFPEQLEQIKIKQLAADEARREKLALAQQQAEMSNMFRAMMLGQGQQRLDMQQSAADAKRDAAQGEVDKQKQAHLSQLGNLKRILTEVRDTPNINSATGAVQSRLHPLVSLTPGDKSTAASRIKNLQEFLQTKGLEDLRRSGVAPGSVTEREWSKFVSRVGNIDPTLSDAAFNKEIDRLLAETEAEMLRVSNAPATVAPPAGGAPKPGGAPKQAPAAAIEHLKKNPHLAEQFKQKYGYLP